MDILELHTLGCCDVVSDLSVNTGDQLVKKLNKFTTGQLQCPIR